jgi:hypothetical protein
MIAGRTVQAQPQTRRIHASSAGSCPPWRTTMTGTCDDRTTAEVTEPKRIPAYPLRPPLPRTTSWAFLDSSTSQRSGTSQTSRLCTCTSIKRCANSRGGQKRACVRPGDAWLGHRRAAPPCELRSDGCSAATPFLRRHRVSFHVSWSAVEALLIREKV